ncbi:hypothetical protein D9619_001914 [Psilocybe cf. subviscida]|uniref:AMP binding protein n=1 Tax=Psilocybe cf. subviscida TaxID=2480587 RepID=A0A8H5BG99_9AGAR|nr:hypothetical protein D9619_001914 [Psilocybe cf. subviscida]
MAPKIYTSPLTAPPLANHSVFTHIFAENKAKGTVGGFPSSKPAFIDAATGTTISRGQLRSLALAFGYGLKAHPNIAAKRGETAMIFSPNSLTWPVVLFGLVAAGLRITLANNAYTAREVAYQYTDSGAKVIFCSEDGVPTARETLQGLGLSKDEINKRIVVMTDGLDWAGGPSAPRKPESAGLLSAADLLRLGSLSEEEKFVGESTNETVYLCYSSGTTGKPKGVETTHKNITTVMDIVAAGVALDPKGERMLGFLPFYHIFGAVKLLHWPLTCDVPVYIMARFDPVQFCANIQKYKITYALIVPPVLVAMARHPAIDQYDLSTLVTMISGAAPLGAELTKAVIARLQTRRKGQQPLNILQGYGLTETSPTTHLVPVADGARKIGSIGVLLPHLQLRLVVDGEGDGLIDAKVGEPGEIWVKGPSIMKGYLNNKEATDNAITSDRWFKTGDIGIRDPEGFYYIVDRRKELIKYKGFQVPPAELESVLLSHPDIADAAVIGVDSAKEATELPRAYVVPSSPETVKTDSERLLFGESIQRWIQSKVAYHKFLRGGVVVIDVVPKSAAGKILRRELRERAKEELAGRDPADNIVKAKL